MSFICPFIARCSDIIQSLPFNMTFDSNDVISMMSEPLNLSTSNIEWCFSSASGYNIVIDFPLPGNDYLVMQVYSMYFSLSGFGRFQAQTDEFQCDSLL